MLAHSQNYINNKDLVLKLVSFADFRESRLVLEIGPGKGIITDELIKWARRVIVVEADRKLATSLQRKYVGRQGIQIVQEDILKYNLPREPFIIVSNIPFNITADIVRKITSADSELQSAYLIMQREAGIKFLGAPLAHSPLFSHFLQINFEIKKLFDIPRVNYTPRPGFDTVFMLFQRRNQPVLGQDNEGQFKDFLVYMFERGKLQIKEALKSVMSNLQVKIILESLNIPENTNIKKIIFPQWVLIFETFLGHAPLRFRMKIRGAYKKLLIEQAQLIKINRTRKDV